MWYDNMPMHFCDASRSMQTSIQLRVETKYCMLLQKYQDSVGLYVHILSVLMKKEYRRWRRLGKRVEQRAKQFRPIDYDNTTF